MPGEIARHLLPSITSQLRARHEGLELDLSLPDRYVDITREGYDVVFRVGIPRESELKSRTLAQLDMAQVASPGLVSRHPP